MRGFWLDYSKLSKIWPLLEKKIKERSIIKTESQKNIKLLKLDTKSSIWDKIDIEKYEKEFPTINNVEELIKFTTNGNNKR